MSLVIAFAPGEVGNTLGRHGIGPHAQDDHRLAQLARRRKIDRYTVIELHVARQINELLHGKRAAVIGVHGPHERSKAGQRIGIQRWQVSGHSDSLATP